jgi:hypothetical protein
MQNIITKIKLAGLYVWAWIDMIYIQVKSFFKCSSTKQVSTLERLQAHKTKTKIKLRKARVTKKTPSKKAN